ncbi:MAG: helix-turn-helix transcriptional regulator, partial [Elusimicrobia bacterium]|nr:helix-turn-helix transcriptional regulator [Elusimicrobiota bacterium]
MITIGAQIKKIRKLKKVTLTELSRRSGVQIATLSRMEHGKMEGTVGSHFQIAKALGVDIVNIYQGVQEEEAQPVSSQETLETLSPPNEKVSQEILSRQP